MCSEKECKNFYLASFNSTIQRSLRRTLVRHSFMRRRTSTAEALRSVSEVHVLYARAFFNRHSPGDACTRRRTSTAPIFWKCAMHVFRQVKINRHMTGQFCDFIITKFRNLKISNPPPIALFFKLSYFQIKIHLIRSNPAHPRFLSFSNFQIITFSN